MIMLRNFTGFFIVLVVIFCVESKAQEKKMGYRNLTPEEKYVIVHRGTEKPFPGSIINLMKKVSMFAKGVDLHFINPMLSLIRTVDGRVLMMKSLKL